MYHEFSKFIVIDYIFYRSGTYIEKLILNLVCWCLMKTFSTFKREFYSFNCFFHYVIIFPTTHPPTFCVFYMWSTSYIKNTYMCNDGQHVFEQGHLASDNNIEEYYFSFPYINCIGSSGCSAEHEYFPHPWWMPMCPVLRGLYVGNQDKYESMRAIVCCAQKTICHHSFNLRSFNYFFILFLEFC